MFEKRKKFVHSVCNCDIDWLQFGFFCFRYANFDRVCLPVVKQGIHHPNQATVYKCQIDDFNNKPPIENARSSTHLDAAKFFQDSKSRRSQTSISGPVSLSGDVSSLNKLKPINETINFNYFAIRLKRQLDIFQNKISLDGLLTY